MIEGGAPNLRTRWDYTQILPPHPMLPAEGSAVCPVDKPHRIFFETSFLALPSDQS